MLTETTLFGVEDKVKDALQMLKDLEPPEGYYLAFSGGKDSVVIKKIVEMSGVKSESWYSNTTIDPPDLIYFIREYHPDVRWINPEENLIKKIETKGFPMRQKRWCCELYKEGGGSGRFVITGIRAAESSKRAGRKKIETCYKGGGKRYLNLIHDWSDDEVWEFIKEYNVHYCKLYDEGWHRVGCIACPYARPHQRLRDLERYPGYEKLYRKSFQALWEKGQKEGRSWKDKWKDGDEMFDWWLTGEGSSEDPDQTVMFE